jgi:hypothetical protein
MVRLWQCLVLLSTVYIQVDNYYHADDALAHSSYPEDMAFWLHLVQWSNPTKAKAQRSSDVEALNAQVSPVLSDATDLHGIPSCI